MKKILLIVILFSFVFIDCIYADKANDGTYEIDNENYEFVECTYNIRTTDGKEMDLTFRREEIPTYNEETRDSYRYFTIYDGKKNEIEFDDLAGGMVGKAKLGDDFEIKIKGSAILSVDSTNNMFQYTGNTTPGKRYTCKDGKDLGIYNNFNGETVITDQREEGIVDSPEGKTAHSLDELYINVEDKELVFRDYDWTCKEVLGPVLTKIVQSSFLIFQMVAAIIAIVKGMIELIPAIVAKDASALKKASKNLVTMAVLLVIIILLSPICKFLGHVLGFDVSCLFE